MRGVNESLSSGIRKEKDVDTRVDKIDKSGKEIGENTGQMSGMPAVLILLVILATITAIPVISVASANSGEYGKDYGNYGKEIYEKKCLMCHGEKGDGQKTNGVDFSSKEFWAEKTDEELIDAIKNGKGNMPSFPDLSDEEIGKVLEYIRGFAGIGLGITETPAPELTPKKTETPEKIVTEKKSPGFGVTTGILVLTGLGLLNVLRKGRKRI